MERRTRGGRDTNGRRTVRGRRRVVTFYERTKRIVFYRNRRTRRVTYANLIYYDNFYIETLFTYDWCLFFDQKSCSNHPNIRDGFGNKFCLAGALGM